MPLLLLNEWFIVSTSQKKKKAYGAEFKFQSIPFGSILTNIHSQKAWTCKEDVLDTKL